MALVKIENVSKTYQMGEVPVKALLSAALCSVLSSSPLIFFLF